MKSLTTRRRCLTHTAAMGLGLGTGLLTAAPSSRAQTPTSSDNRMSNILRDRASVEGMGLATAEISAEGVRQHFGGKRSATDKAPPDAHSAFEYGSVTKTFVGVLLADMAHKRELALDEPVEAALGQNLRDSAGTPITWEDLATQRSGLPRLPPNFNPRVPADPYADFDVAQLTAFLSSWKASVPRQQRWEYSNLGFGVLGHALSRRAGKPFDQLMRERVLQPLGLGGIGVAMTGTPAPRLLQGHNPEGVAVPRWTFDTLAGAGALWGTSADLARYAQAALGLIETPLKAAFELAMKDRAATDKPSTRIGLAWLLGRLNGRAVANHDGGTYGFSSSLFLDLERKRASVALANAMVPVTDLALHALDASIPPRNVAAERQQTQRQAVDLKPEELAPLVGVYALNPQFKITFRAHNGKLFAQATGQGEFELFALDARRFFARVAALEVHFDAPGDKAQPQGMTLHQGGGQMRFVRE